MPAAFSASTIQEVEAALPPPEMQARSFRASPQERAYTRMHMHTNT